MAMYTYMYRCIGELTLSIPQADLSIETDRRKQSIPRVMSGLFSDWSLEGNSSSVNVTNCTEWNSTLVNATDACSSTDVAMSFDLNMIRLIVLIPSCIVIVVCSCVLFLLLKLRELRDVTNALIVNSALADLLRGFVGLLNTYLYIRPLPANDLNYVLCQIFLFSHLFLGFWSSWSMSLLAYDRYDLLAHPLRRKLRAKRVAIILAIILSVDAFLCSTPKFGWSEYLFYRLPSNPDLAKCRLSQQETNAADWAFLPTFDVCAYIIPCCLTIIIYAKMVKLVVSHIRKSQESVCRATNSRSRYLNSQRMTTAARSITQYHSTMIRMQEFPTNSLQASQSDPLPHLESSSTPMLIIKSKAFRLVMIATASNILLTLPFVIVLQFEKFRVIVIKVFPDVMKSVLMALFFCNFVVNSIIYVFWVQNAIKIVARQGFERRGLVGKLVGLCCLGDRAQTRNV